MNLPLKVSVHRLSLGYRLQNVLFGSVEQVKQTYAQWVFYRSKMYHILAPYMCEGIF